MAEQSHNDKGSKATPYTRAGKDWRQAHNFGGLGTGLQLLMQTHPSFSESGESWQISEV
jgi:hypothetical protein